jgi:hypothetical protein
LEFQRTETGDVEVSARAIPLSVPSRRLLSAIAAPTSVADLARQVRLGELERHLQELVTRGLVRALVLSVPAEPANPTEPVASVDTVALPAFEMAATSVAAILDRPTPTSVPARRPMPAEAAEPLLAQLSEVDLQEIRRLAVHFVRERVGPAADDITARIDRAKTQEALLMELGAAQRALFDLRGRSAAVEFFDKVVAPSFYG